MFQVIWFWQFLSMFGDIQFWIGAAATALIIYFLAPKQSKKYIAWFIFGALPAVVVSWAMAEGLKLLFKIPRPCAGLSFCETGYSFPSGHAAVIFAAMSVAIVYSKSRKMDFSFFALALIVSLSRVFLGVHTIEDIIVGGLIGFAVGRLVYKNYGRILQKIKLRQ
jgi:undecaprenyl-diphosphatase